MAEHRLTGGSKEFHYTKDDAERIRSTDTESSKEFKQAYRKWEEQKTLERLKAEERRLERMRKKLIIGLIVVLSFLLIIGIIRLLKG